MHVQPYLCFYGRCEEALEFYRTKLGAEVTLRLRFSDSPDPAMCANGPADTSKIMHSSFRIGDLEVCAADGPGEGESHIGGFSLSITVTDAGEGERLFATLADGGQVQMPLTETFFAKRFGMVADRFGISWMIVAAPTPVPATA